MNFFERLVADWYGHRGYLVKLNVRFEPLANGGYGGEADVLGIKLDERKIVHIETSADASPWKARFDRFERTFESATDEHYFSALHIPRDFKIEQVERLVYVGVGSPSVETRAEIEKFEAKVRARVFSTDKLVRDIVEYVRKIPKGTVIPESYGYLRAMQFALLFSGVDPK